MSEVVSFVTSNDKKSIYSASMISGNSAPRLTFVEDIRYISFNNDSAIEITAGSYSKNIQIFSSDLQPFLTNVNVNLSSTGFVFEPSQIFIKLGDKLTTFRIGADSGLLPIYYFYEATKQEETKTYYTITTNNNIKVTNKQIEIATLSTISVPLGGCSEPYVIKLTNPPFTELIINFNYDNFKYDENLFYPNPHVTKSYLTFNKDNDNNTISFCAGKNLNATQIIMTLKLAGVNFNSYKFISDTITFVIVPAV
jgi:hypothetical protein